MFESENKKPTIKKYISSFLIFIMFQIIFGILIMPLLIFYGPFENVKRSVVGMSINSSTKQYVARFFLSNETIVKILEETYAKDLTEEVEEIEDKVDVVETHTGKMEVFNIKGDNFDGKMIIVYDPTRLIMGYSSKIPQAGETTSTIAKRNNAIAAINGGGFKDNQFAGTGGSPMGFIMHNGKVIYNDDKSENKKIDTVAFTEKGMLIVGKHTIKQLKKYKVKEAVSFGPALIVNGKPTISKGDGGWGIAPRTAIAQRKDGAVLLLVVDGRSFKSFGATLRDIQDIFIEYNAVNAVNLDGGSSATMYYNGRVINTPTDALGERSVPSIFMVGQEIPNEMEKETEKQGDEK